VYWQTGSECDRNPELRMTVLFAICKMAFLNAWMSARNSLLVNGVFVNAFFVFLFVVREELLLVPLHSICKDGMVHRNCAVSATVFRHFVG
jgi:hypothetical protein